MALPSDLPREISREAMLELPIRRYEGEIVLVESAQAATDAWICRELYLRFKALALL
jgi:hypothetical protein